MINYFFIIFVLIGVSNLIFNYFSMVAVKYLSPYLPNTYSSDVLSLSFNILMEFVFAVHLQVN